MNQFNLKNYIVEPQKISKRMIHKDHNVAAFMLSIAKGETLPNHTHFDCSVLVQVIHGSATMKVDENQFPIESGMLIFVQGHEKLSVNNTGNETLALYVTLSPNPPYEQYTTDMDI